MLCVFDCVCVFLDMYILCINVCYITYSGFSQGHHLFVHSLYFFSLVFSWHYLPGVPNPFITRQAKSIGSLLAKWPRLDEGFITIFFGWWCYTSFVRVFSPKNKTCSWLIQIVPCSQRLRWIVPHVFPIDFNTYRHTLRYYWYQPLSSQLQCLGCSTTSDGSGGVSRHSWAVSLWRGVA